MRFTSFVNRLDPVERCLAGGVVLLLVCYMTVFLIIPGARNTLPAVAVDALINVGAVALWGALAWWVNLRALLDRSIRLQALAHPLLGFAFAVAWYFSVTVLLGWRAGDFSGSFSVRPFVSVAFIWQIFQGLTVYALVVALAVIRRLLDRAPAPAARGAARLLVRVDDEFVSVPVDDIVCIERAGDYAQLLTTRGKYLTRKSLAQLERELPAGRFVRVHRSHLINLNALESAESIGGGRLRARLTGDVQVETSRTGARLLRDCAG